MIVFRRRLLFWLLREYAKRWRKTFFVFFVCGICAFFVLKYLLAFFIPKIPIGQKEVIGIVGAYTIDTLPSSILFDISKGLTLVEQDGSIKPAASLSWKIKNDGKTYTFTLNKNLSFTDGSPLTASSITYNFSDVSFHAIDTHTLEFRLKYPYAPFLATVSRPFFKKGFVGIGEYSLRNLEQNGNFITSMSLVSRKNQYKARVYLFYPSEDALKLAFALGEVSKALHLSASDFKNTSLEKFPSVSVTKITNYERLVTLFYNTEDKTLSDKRLRQSLAYTLADEFSQGVRSYTPFPQNFWAYQKSVNEPKFDLAHSQVLFSASGSSSESANLVLSLKTLGKYKKTAQTIGKAFEKIRIQTKIEVIDNVPSDFQIFLGDFNVPKDPDQYTLWHSNQENNITKFKNLRIDKLLEDGRKTQDTSQRKKIYADFLKYLLDEAPATFLYFPYEYDVVRK